MLNIIFKDIYQNRKLIIGYFAILLLVNILVKINIFGNDISAASLLAMMVPFGLALKSEVYEQKNKAYRLLKNLPISNTKIVASKFLGSIIIGIITIIFTLIVAAIVSGDLSIIKSTLPFSTAAILISLILTGFTYTISFKFGAEKANVFIVILLGLLVFIGQLGIFLARQYVNTTEKTFIYKMLVSIIVFFENTQGYILLMLGISLYFATFLISIRSFNKSKVI